MASNDWSSTYLSGGGKFYSTNLANKIQSYQMLADRICYDLGYPLVKLEIHGQQLYTCIARAVEFYSRYAGYTEEFLVFNSQLYTRGKGINLEELLTNTPELTATYSSTYQTLGYTNTSVPTVTSVTIPENSINTFIPVYEFNVGDVYIDPSEYNFTVVLSDTNVQVSKMLSVATSGDDIATVSSTEYGIVFTTLTEIFELSTYIVNNDVTIGIIPKTNKGGTINATRNATSNDSTVTEYLTTQNTVIGNFDELTKQYRKVISVYSFDESSNSSVNTLFSIEQTLAQQTYFSYSMGNYGFDLISWYILKQWLETRSKMLALSRRFKFDAKTQHLLMLPEPKPTETFYGVLGVYVEQPIVHLIQEPWVFNYALALAKIAIGRVRSKYTGTQLFGNGSPNAELLQEGLSDKKELEQQILQGTGGMADMDPPMFFVG
jgi:hypothetical protein